MDKIWVHLSRYPIGTTFSLLNRDFEIIDKEEEKFVFYLEIKPRIMFWCWWNEMLLLDQLPKRK